MVAKHVFSAYYFIVEVIICLNFLGGLNGHRVRGASSEFSPSADQLNAAFQIKQDYADVPRGVRAFGVQSATEFRTMLPPLPPH